MQTGMLFIMKQMYTKLERLETDILQDFINDISL